MRIKLAYGRDGLWIELPDSWEVTVVEPAYVPGLAAPETVLAAALRAPRRHSRSSLTEAE